MRNFPTPHCHIQSFDSGSTPEAFIERELELGTGTITVTDHGSMSACRKVYDLAKAKKLTPILGLEAYFRDDNCEILKAHGINEPAKYLKYYHLTLHATDDKAFGALSQKLSDARVERHGSEPKPLLNWADLEELGQYNITMTTGCLVGMVQRHIMEHGRWDLAKAYYEKLRGICKCGHFFVEAFPHKCDKNWVAGIFVDFEGGQKMKFHDKKKLRFQHFGETEAIELVKAFGTKRWNPEDKLIAVMNNRKWEDIEPKRVAIVKKIEEFLPNECQVWCPNGDVQAGCNKAVIELANEYGDPILVSDDSHYAHEDEKIVQDVRLQQMGNWRFYGHYHRQSSEEAFKYFNAEMGVDRKTFEGWVDNNVEWAERFKGFSFDHKPSLPTSFYPSNTLEHTIALVKKHGRMDWQNPVYVNRLKAEIDLLHKNGVIDLLPYFFVGEEINAYYETLGKLTGPGRGSAAGLLLAYLLGITHVDPIKYNLSMDRFLTIDRVKSGKLPDIDSDFGDREPLIDHEKGWLKQRFGDCYAQISVDVALKLKSSIKDVARATSGHVSEHIEELTKQMKVPPQGVSDADFVFGYADSGEWRPGSIETDEALKAYIKTYTEQWKIVQKCLGLTRQKGRHASAFVIANKPLKEFIPLQQVSGVTVTQYTAPSVEASGGIKIDLLCVNQLNDIEDCIKLVQKGSGVEIPDNAIINGRRVPKLRILPVNGQLYDIWDLPEDLAVFRDICEGKTESVFQFNANSAKQWLTHFNHYKNEAEGRKAIDSIEAMAAFTALDRPGPLDAYVEDKQRGIKHNMLVEYARRARGEEPIGALPVMMELLPETYGILTFQEQLQRLYQQMTGCTGAEAEEFRSNIAKKKMDKVLKAYEPFIERASAKVGEENAKEIWTLAVSWASYGFNASHATSYCIIAYACAYLKHHFATEWWCSVLRNADRNEIYEKFWAYAGHLVDFPDISVSKDEFEIVNGRIRAPLSMLAGVGPAAHKQIMAYVPYTSLHDLCTKIEKHCVDGAVPVFNDDGTPVILKSGKNKGKQQYRRGHNALGRTVLYKLTTSGALDNLFPKDEDGDELPLLEKLHLLEKAYAETRGDKQVRQVKPAYTNLSPLERYQIKRQIIPAYSENLVKKLSELKVPEVSTDPRTGKMLYATPKGRLRIVESWEIERINSIAVLPTDHTVRVAAPAYVVAQRAFFDGKAVELILDIDGYHQLKVVKWASKKTNQLEAEYTQNLVGAIVMVALVKFSESKPFAIDQLSIVQAPLGKAHKEESPDTDED